ncbi:MAG: hypothetical protein M3R25_04285 [Bacteroidota bacterium]|nr:hypothetical protein [Bacteroidota bacterium]
MIRYRTTWMHPCQFVIGFILILGSCKEKGQEESGLAAYYLPYQSFPSEGMTYTYRSRLDTLNREIWKHIPSSGTTITSINYDNNQQVVQKQYERIAGDGVYVDSLTLFFPEPGRVIEMPVKVVSPRKLPFDAAATPNEWVTQLDWIQPGDSLHVVLARGRKFAGDTTWMFDGKKHDAIIFNLTDKFETEQVGWTSSEWTGKEIYAKGIGMVYYLRQISPRMKLEFELERRE